MMRAVVGVLAAMIGIAAAPAFSQGALSQGSGGQGAGGQGSGQAPGLKARRVTVVPYVEVGQIIDADLSGGDVVTYSSLGAGVDALVETKRISGQVSYRYERRFSWEKRIGDSDIHTGLGRVSVRAMKDLTIEGGGIATRTRADIRGASPGLLGGNPANTSQVYSAYVGPNYAGSVGRATVAASYFAGYTAVGSPGFTGVDGNAQRLDRYDDSIAQVARGSVGFAPGVVAPVGLTATAGYAREDTTQLDQRYIGRNIRGDALLPVSAHVALTAGVGHEHIEVAQRSPLTTAAGTPVVDRSRRFVTDEASPRRIAYRTDGLYYDAGVIWRPNRRASIEGHVGKRYGSLSYTGTATYRPSPGVGFAAQLYDGVTTFGQQLQGGLRGLPTNFIANRDILGQQYNGCVFGTSDGAPGACLNDVFQSVSTAVYRARGLDAILSATRGRSTYGIGGGYVNRRLFVPEGSGGAGPATNVYTDESWYAQAFYGRTLSRNSVIDTNLFVNYFEPGLADGILSYGAVTNYRHSFGRLTTSAALGLYSYSLSDADDAWNAQGVVAARYSF